MPLQPGQSLLHYRLFDKIGEGGMGEVYRADDTRLDRQVAIKVLPAELSSDADRLARFEREARTLAALHHPHVASIFGFEKAGGVSFLVMELVEGEDLAQRLSRGALGTAEALEFARQIAEGLEAAHEAGIIHRDLKPANVRITPDGTVKVLDFGLAKGVGGKEGDSFAGSGDLSQSPTLAQTGTAAGLILGTAAYMSPEQARGKPLDKRSDIWSYGVVLFEMLSGSRLFTGETVSDVLASVLKTEVDFSALPDSTPAAVRRLLRRCLERHPRQRLRDIGDARIEIAAALAGDDAGSTAADETTQAASRARVLMPWLVAATALLAVAATLMLRPAGYAPPSAGSYELSLAPPESGRWHVGSNIGWGAISPDGRQVVVSATTTAGSGLMVRSLDGKDSRLLPRTEDGFYPFWSPDSRWVAFFNRGLLQRIEVDGGLPERICDAPWGRGGSWSESGQILFTPNGGGFIHLVDAEGGEPRPVTSLDIDAGEDAHYWPVWLPGGRQFLYFIRSGQRDQQGIYLGRILEDGPDQARRRIVASSSSGVLAQVGDPPRPMLLWIQDEVLLARALDLQTGALSGSTSRIAESVRVLGSQRAAMISISSDGTLVWASSRFGERRLAWFDRQGKGPEILHSQGTNLLQAATSWDGRWVAYVAVEEGRGAIWLHDTSTGQSRAMTSSLRYEENETWSPDSTEIIFARGGGEHTELIRLPIDGSEAPQSILTEAIQKLNLDNTLAWLPGDWLVLETNSYDGTMDLVAVNLNDQQEVQPLLAGPGNQFDGAAAPGGDALGFLSDETGKGAAYIVSLQMVDGRPVPGTDRQRVPVADPLALRWGLEGNELFALAADGSFFVMPVRRQGGRLSIGIATKLFEIPQSQGDSNFGIGAGDQRFIFSIEPDAEHQALPVLLNWPARLEQADQP